jgi:flagellar biosynthetic protein FlhB
MAEDDSGERNQAPSGKRRNDFRKKGQVAQSKEVQNASLFTIVLLFWIFYLPTFWRGLLTLIHQLWQSTGSIHVTPASIISLGGYILQKIALLLAPLFLLVVLVGFFSSFFQIGWLFTSNPLIPDFAKLNQIGRASCRERVS